jgi:nitrous oxidase accessory protein
MKKITTIALLLSFSFVLVSLPEINVAEAAPNTIIVPDDYSTIQGAIDAASEGDTVFVKKGTYEGSINQTLVINKTISLMGEEAENTIMNMHPPKVPQNIFMVIFWVYANPIKIEANGVKLAGFTITSDGGSISATGNGIQIIDNTMSMDVSVTGDEIQVVGNAMTSLELNGSNQIIANNTISGNSGNSDNEIFSTGSYNTFTSNNVAGGGIYIHGFHNLVYLNSLTAGSGLGINGDDTIVAMNNVSSVVGVSGAFNIVYGNTITSNLVIYGNDNLFYTNYIQGLILGTGTDDPSNNMFYHNYFNFVENEVLPEGDKTFTVIEGVRETDYFLDNGIEGNYWSDYAGTDANSDGIGDTSYVVYTNDTRNYHFRPEDSIANIILTDHYPLMAPTKIFDAGTWEWANYIVDVISNSTVSDFSFSPESTLIQFVVEGETGTTGFFRVTIPKDMLQAENTWIVLVDDIPLTPTVIEYGNNSYIYFQYQHSTRTIKIIGTKAIPEFPLWISMLVILTVFAVAVAVCRRKLTKMQST